MTRASTADLTLVASPEAEDLPPPALREKLRPNETILWWSRGKGSTLDERTSWFVPLVCTASGALLLAALPGEIGRWSATLGFAIAIAVVIYRLFAAAGLELYALTNDRVLFIPGAPPVLCFSLHRDGGSAGAISELLVTGKRDKGHLRLQSAFGRHSTFRHRPIRLTGIKRPLEVAALIKATLHLPMPVEDRTRSPKAGSA